MKTRGLGRQAVLSAISLLVILTVFSTGVQAQDLAGRKAVVILIDNMSLEDLGVSSLPNLGRLVKDGSLGLMNARTGSLAADDRFSGCLSIGMGMRAQIPAGQQDLAIRNRVRKSDSAETTLDTEDLSGYVKRKYHGNVLGRIGETLRRSGKKTGLVGNADSDRVRLDAALIAMDSRGSLDFMQTGRDLLIQDAGFPWGFRTNADKLLVSALRAMDSADFVVVDTGDPARVVELAARKKLTPEKIAAYRSEAMANADRFLGKFMAAAAGRDFSLLIISPTVSVYKRSTINRTLTPVILYDLAKSPGLLSSDTTKQPGLVANVDVGPTILVSLGLRPGISDFTGKPVNSIPAAGSLETVRASLAGFIHLKKARYVIHGIYTLLLAAGLALIYIPYCKPRTTLKGKAATAAAVMVTALPAATFLMPWVVRLMSPALRWSYLDVAAVILAVAAAGLVGCQTAQRALNTMALLAGVTTGYLIFDLLLGTGLLLQTPLGFDDVFMGGRYYGINNDSMGILIGSAVFAMFYFFDLFRMAKAWQVACITVVFALMVLSQTPGYGAKVGGTVAAMATGLFSLTAVLSGKPIGRAKIAGTILAVCMIEFIIAFFDYQAGAQTHAGRLVAAMLAQGFWAKMLEVLRSKMDLWLFMLVLPPWNILLAVQFYIIYHIRSRRDRATSVWHSRFEVILWGGLVAFFFNDTGVIATAMMFTYLTMPMGVMLNSTKEYWTSITQKI